MENKRVYFKGREWTCDETHSMNYWGCFTCETIRTGIDHRIDIGIETEDGRGVAHAEGQEAC